MDDFFKYTDEIMNAWADAFDLAWDPNANKYREKSPGHVCFVPQPDGTTAELTRLNPLR